MKSQVTVVADDNGNVIRQSSNPEVAYVRVAQDVVQYGSTGWVNKKTRSALIFGSPDDLKSIGLGKEEFLPGRIVVKESTEPFSETDPDRNIKRAGENGPICCTADGEAIYRTTFYDATGQQQDEFVAHANGAAIREAMSNGASKIAKDEGFDLEKKKTKKSKNKSNEIVKEETPVLDSSEETEEISEEISNDVENVELTEDTFEL